MMPVMCLSATQTQVPTIFFILEFFKFKLGIELTVSKVPFLATWLTLVMSLLLDNFISRLKTFTMNISNTNVIE